MKAWMIVVGMLMVVLPAMPETDDGQDTGQALYLKHCKVCHGKRGTRGISGARKLQKSHLTDAEYARIIRNGKGKMPAWKDELSAGEIEQIILYIKTLRK